MNPDMRNEKSKIRDEELPAVLFLLNEIERGYFDKDFRSVSGAEIETYVDDMNLFNGEIKSMSSKTVSNIFELLEGDQGTRPKKINIERMLSFHLRTPTSIELFTLDFEARIDGFFQTLEYRILERNPQPNKQRFHPVKTKSIHLAGSQLSINLSEGAIGEIVQAVAPIVGDVLSEAFQNERNNLSSVPTTRIGQRLNRQRERRQQNIEKVLKKTLGFARNVVGSRKEVDVDWMVEFFNLVQDCSHEKLQYVWAKLLLDEVVEPGTISRRTLSVLKLLTPKEARAFNALSSCIWSLNESSFGTEKMLIKDLDSDGCYSDYSWGFDGSLITQLKESGLVTEMEIELDSRRVYIASFFGEQVELKALQEKQKLNVILLTCSGEDLLKVICPEPNHDYRDVTLNYFRSLQLIKG